ncbi:MAG: flagellar hook-associated protein FlgK [Pseudomonadota bacterium]
MSIGMILNVAKDALLTQQYAIDIVSHNITNVNTEGYSRQSPVFKAKQAVPIGGFMFGRGVELGQILRDTDTYIENSLQQRESDLAALSQKETYLNVMEGIFNESSDWSLSTQFAEFWSAWQDLSNNPSGLAERSILFESGSLLAQSFNSIYSDLDKLTDEINNGMEAGVDHINQLLARIADINEQIVTIEATGNANDLRDQRNMLVRGLSDYIDITTYENGDGSINVTAGGGYTLVTRANAYELSFDGSDVKWQGSNNSEVTVTDAISGGKLGGWLDVRDEILPKYTADFNELAESVIWELNKIHTQGVGLTGFTDLTGSYGATLDSSEEMGTSDSGLAFYEGIEDEGSFKFWLYDDSGNVVGGGATTLTIDNDPGGTTLQDLADSITAIHANVTATVTSDNKLQIASSGSYTFGFSDDTSNVLAALGLNTFFKGTDAGTMAVNPVLASQKSFIAAAKIDGTGNFVSGDNANALDIADLQYGGVDLKRWTYARGSSPVSEDVTGTTLETYLHSLVGSVGIKSQSIRREKEYNEVIANQLSQTRDSISAVSLDEEMSNLIKYQQAYAAAAKLISVADEMFTTLLQAR